MTEPQPDGVLREIHYLSHQNLWHVRCQGGGDILDTTAHQHLTTGETRRASGAVRIAAHSREGRSHLATHYQKGSLKTLFPRARSHSLDTVFLNTAGGITGGDRFAFDLSVGAGASMTATSQAAERIYKAQGQTQGRVDLIADIATGGRLNWLPQETILFDQARLQRTFNISMTEDAELLCGEPLVFGREAMGETVNTAHLNDQWRIHRSGKLVFADALTITGPASSILTNPATAQGCRAAATILFISQNAELKRDRARRLLGSSGGASLIRPGVLLIRMLAQDSFEMRKTMIPTLEWLSDGPIPKTWSL